MKSFRSLLEDTPVRTAVRFPLQLDIVLHTAERSYTAQTEDISANGVLFSATEVPAIGERVRFLLTMPAAAMGSERDVMLECTGRIVRHGRVGGKTLKAAAMIDDYSLKGQ